MKSRVDSNVTASSLLFIFHYIIMVLTLEVFCCMVSEILEQMK